MGRRWRTMRSASLSEWPYFHIRYAGPTRARRGVRHAPWPVSPTRWCQCSEPENARLDRRTDNDGCRARHAGAAVDEDGALAAAAVDERVRGCKHAEHLLVGAVGERDMEPHHARVPLRDNPRGELVARLDQAEHEEPAHARAKEGASGVEQGRWDAECGMCVRAASAYRLVTLAAARTASSAPMPPSRRPGRTASASALASVSMRAAPSPSPSRPPPSTARTAAGACRAARRPIVASVFSSSGSGVRRGSGRQRGSARAAALAGGEGERESEREGGERAGERAREREREGRREGGREGGIERERGQEREGRREGGPAMSCGAQQQRACGGKTRSDVDVVVGDGALHSGAAAVCACVDAHACVGVRRRLRRAVHRQDRAVDDRWSMARRIRRGHVVHGPGARDPRTRTYVHGSARGGEGQGEGRGEGRRGRAGVGGVGWEARSMRACVSEPQSPSHAGALGPTLAFTRRAPQAQVSRESPSRSRRSFTLSVRVVGGPSQCRWWC